MKIFLCGERGIGKSTIISKVLEAKDYSLGGFFTKAGDTYVRMHYASNTDNSFVIGKRKVSGDTKAFNTEGVKLLKESFNSELVIMDEIGWMESEAELFGNELIKVLDNSENVLGVLREGCKTPLTEQIKARRDICIINVTKDNRDEITGWIMQNL